MHVPLSRDPVLRPQGFYGRKPDLRWLGDQLGRAYPQNVNIVGEPRSGKTSLLSQISAWQMGRLPENECLYLWLRLVTLPQRSGFRFWQFFWRQLKRDGRHFGLEWDTPRVPDEPWALFSEIEAILTTLTKKHGVKRMLILVDDFDYLLDGLERRDLDWMLVLATQFRQELGFAITSTIPMSDIEKTVLQQENPEPWQPMTQFSSNFKTRWVGLLSDNEARSLCQRSTQFEEAEMLSDDEIQFLIRETGPHPDLLKVGLAYYLEAREYRDTPDLHQSVRLDIRLDDHAAWLCRQLWQRRSPVEQAALTALANGTQPEDTFLLQAMQKKAALVLFENDTFRVFADLFAHWIRRWTSRPEETAVPAPPPAPPEVDAILTYRADKRLAHNGEEEIKLTPLEGRLLSYFLTRENEVCNLDDLLANVWGPGKSQSVVEKAVNRLRQKIEIDPQRPRFILSARGEGYILRLS